MATISRKNVKRLPDPGFDGVPYGNLSALVYTVELNSSGAVVDSNSAAAIADGDIVRAGLLPGGARIVGAEAIVSDAFVSATTIDVGFEYVDGVDDSVVPQDADYMFDGLDVASTGRNASNTANAPVRTAKDAYVTVTFTVGEGASQDDTARVDIVVYAELAGRR